MNTVILLCLYALKVVADDTDKTTDLKITTIITNSNLGSDFSVNTDLSTTTTSSSSSSSSWEPSDTSIASSLATEDKYDRDMFKYIFTASGYYYDMPVHVNDQSMDLRLDILQNDVWVMNGNEIMNCSHIDEWWASEESVYSTYSDEYFPSSLTTREEYTATVCADSGVFTTDGAISDVPEPSYGSLDLGDKIKLPYLNAVNASGVVTTGNLSLINAKHERYTIDNMAIIDVNDTNVLVGGIGFAKNKLTNTGVLENLVAMDIINASSYSLYFNTFSDTGLPFAQVVPGISNSKYYIGDLHLFPMLDTAGVRYPISPDTDIDNDLISHLVVPSIQLDDISIENEQNGNTLSLKSESGSLAAIFDTRTLFNFMPLDIIVNLAVQTNAFYNSEVNRWIVVCDTIRNAQASVKLTFNGFDVSVPLENLIVNATTYDNTSITFSDGSDACYLDFLPSSSSYATLGLSVLKSLYIVVDNEGKNIGLGRSNNLLSIKQSNYLPLDHDVTNLSDDDLEDYIYSNDTYLDRSSIKLIGSDYIPHATTPKAEEQVTLSYSSNQILAGTVTLPARFSGVVLTSGEVFITQTVASPSLAIFATAASEDDGKSSDAASGLRIISNSSGEPLQLIFSIMLLLLPIGVMIM